MLPGRCDRRLIEATIVGYLILLFATSISIAQSPCAGIRDTGEFGGCVEDTAMFQCRQSRSVDELKVCFRTAARALLGNRASEVETFLNTVEIKKKPLNFACTDWQFPGQFACHLLGGDWGAPPEWCYRNDAQTVSWCEGDPPNHTCKRISCPLSSCNTSSEFSRCSMIWNPAVKD